MYFFIGSCYTVILLASVNFALSCIFIFYLHFLTNLDVTNSSRGNFVNEKFDPLSKQVSNVERKCDFGRFWRKISFIILVLIYGWSASIVNYI